MGVRSVSRFILANPVPVPVSLHRDVQRPFAGERCTRGHNRVRTRVARECARVYYRSSGTRTFKRLKLNGLANRCLEDVDNVLFTHGPLRVDAGTADG